MAGLMGLNAAADATRRVKIVLNNMMFGSKKCAMFKSQNE
jgi:hypothetical protein